MDNLDTLKTVRFVRGQDKPGVSCQEKLCTDFEIEKKKKKKIREGSPFWHGHPGYLLLLFFFEFFLKTLSVAEY